MKPIQSSIHSNYLEHGQSLFELILAVGVSAVIIVVLVSLVNNAVQGANFSRNQTLATRYAEEATEWLRTERDTSIDTFLTNATTAPLSYCLVTTSWTKHSTCATTDVITGTIFLRQVDFTTLPLAKTVIRANISVTWSDSKGTHKASSVSDYSDWRQRP